METKTKKAKKKKEKVLLVFILDKSGSMHVCKKDVIGGFNEYLKKQQAEKKDIFLTMYQFDDVFETSFSAQNAKEVSVLTETTYSPRGNTALYDAVGLAIRNTEAYIKTSKEDVKVTFVIMTDGHENASKEFKKDSIKTQIDEKEKQDWIFTYIGATSDAWDAGVGLGINPTNVAQYDSANTGLMISTMLTAYGSGSLCNRDAFSLGGTFNMLSDTDRGKMRSANVSLKVGK